MRHSMRRLGPIALFALGSALPATSALADNTTPTTSGSGKCEGSVKGKSIAGDTFLAIKGGTRLTGNNAGTVFGRAECECRSHDIAMRINFTMPVDRTVSGVATEAWVGSATCSDQTQRTTINTRCQPVNANDPPGNTGFSVQVEDLRQIGNIDIPIPAEALNDPRPVGTPAANYPYTCTNSAGDSRTFYVLILDDPQKPASCSVPLSVKMSLPTPPSDVQVKSGDGALNVSWSVPSGTAGIDAYQILCRKKAAPMQPAMSEEFRGKTAYYFSSCVDGVLYRRPLPGMSKNETPIAKNPAATPFLPTEAAAPIPIDPKFLCSDRIGAMGTQFSHRLTGLDNGSEYEIEVVSIDPYGNAAPAALVSATPQAVVSPLAAFCGEGQDCPAGFGCALTRRSTPTAGGLFGFGLLGLIGLAARRRSARRAS